MWPYVIAILLIVAFSAWLTLRGRKTKIKAIPGKVKGFGHRDEKVVIVFADSSTRVTTWGEIEKKVREINGEKWWIEKKYDILIGGIWCIIGVGATLIVFFLQEAG